MIGGKQRVSKLEAAHRQLDTAIELWYREADAVSIHTLAVAAYQIAVDVIKHRDVAFESIYNSTMVRPQYRKEFIKSLKKNANFFKHADEDPDGVTELHPISAEMFMLNAVGALEALGEQKSDAQSAFLIWTQLHRPDILTDDGLQYWKEMFSEEYLAGVRALSKRDFYVALIEHRKLMRRAE